MKKELPPEIKKMFQDYGSAGGKKSHTHFSAEGAKAAAKKRWAKGKPKRFEGPSICGEDTRAAYISATEEKL